MKYQGKKNEYFPSQRYGLELPPLIYSKKKIPAVCDFHSIMMNYKMLPFGGGGVR